MMRAALALSLIVGCVGPDDPSGQNGPLGGEGETMDDKPPPGMGDRPPGPMPLAPGKVPHFIDADTGDDLGFVLSFQFFGGAPEAVAFSPALDAPVALNGYSTTTVYPLPDCKGPLMAMFPDAWVGKRNPFGTGYLVAPMIAMGPTGTYFRLANKPVRADRTSRFETKFGERICVNLSAAYVDEFTDTKVPGKTSYPNLKIELR